MPVGLAWQLAACGDVIRTDEQGEVKREWRQRKIVSAGRKLVQQIWR